VIVHREAVKPKDVVTTVHLDRETWLLLRSLSELRALRQGGAPSQSAVIRQLVRDAGALEADELRATAAAPERAES
jgi:hypothetical protein